MVVGFAVVDTGALVVVALADVADVVAFTAVDVVPMLVVGVDDSEAFLVVAAVEAVVESELVVDFNP